MARATFIIGEIGFSCLEPEVKKIPYSIDAMNVPFDIRPNSRSFSSAADFNTEGSARRICR